MRIDVHWHHIPSPYVADLRAGRGDWPVTLERDDRGREFLRIRSGGGQFLQPEHHEPELVIEAIVRRRLDMALVSPVANLLHYDLEPQRTLEYAMMINEGIAGLCRQFPDRVLGLATVPLQDPALATAELERAMLQLGLRGVEIATNVNGRNLDEPDFFPFFERAAALNAFVFLHPANTIGPERTSRHNLSNLIGNATDSSIAMASLIFGGVYERLPGLCTCYAHGGGMAPYLLGRWDHCYEAQPQFRGAATKPPSAYFRQVYCDSLTHSAAALRLLVETLGPDHILIGCDHPYEMGDPDPVGSIERAAGIDDASKRLILEENGPRVLGLVGGR
jgi:aminocarboxymuconate-semialdehyde decarboxylase